MSAINANFIHAFCGCALLVVASVACINKQEREAVVEQPVASPTSTRPTGTGDNLEPGTANSGESDVPFDGGRPEALGTAIPGNSPSTGSGQSAAPLESAVFNIYGELLKGSLSCEEVKQ